MKFRKRAILIDAIQLTEKLFWDWYENNQLVFDKFNFQGKWNPLNKTIDEAYIIIPTLEGNMRGNIGDWIIKGIKGEFYPCKPDIFEKTYEHIDENIITHNIPIIEVKYDNLLSFLENELHPNYLNDIYTFIQIRNTILKYLDKLKIDTYNTNKYSIEQIAQESFKQNQDWAVWKEEYIEGFKKGAIWQSLQNQNKLK